MKLTLRELQITMQEQIDMMKTQLQKSKREEYELHERADSHLLTMDGFRKETDFNFREVRAEMAEFRSQLTELKSDVAVLKSDVAELKSDVSGLKTSVGLLREELRAGVSAILGYTWRIDVDHEGRIKALETENSH
ncbi:hypothetical protein BH10CYA1_BH10CYA1_15560 [soil metagenome]